MGQTYLKNTCTLIDNCSLYLGFVVLIADDCLVFVCLEEYCSVKDLSTLGYIVSRNKVVAHISSVKSWLVFVLLPFRDQNVCLALVCG